MYDPSKWSVALAAAERQAERNKLRKKNFPRAKPKHQAQPPAKLTKTAPTSPPADLRELLAAGYSSRAAAQVLGLSLAEVRAQRTRLKL